MSHLDTIIKNVAEKGSHTEGWEALANAYFRGDDWDDQIRAWAKSNGLSVHFVNRPSVRQFESQGSVTFRAVEG